MSLNHSPSIVTNGLVMYYDMNNTQKSWVGAPATNLVVTVPYTQDVYNSCSGPVSTTGISDATGQLRVVNRYTITATSSTPRARIIATGLTTGVNYSYSLKIKYNGPTGSPTWYIDSSKGNPEGGINNNTFTSLNTNSVYLGNGWYQLTATFNFATCPTGGAWANFGLTAPDATYLNQTFDAYDIQFEQNTYATPYVAGTRASTSAIIDLTNNNTITSTLTYSATGTFSFNGTSNWIDVSSNTNTALQNSYQTISLWVNINSVGPNGEALVWGVSGGAAQTWIGWTPGGVNFWCGSNVILVSIASVNSYNQWMNVTYIIDRIASTFTLYKNGVYVGVVSFTTYTPSATTVTIGKNTRTGNAGDFTNGSISNIQLYNRRLSATEVAQNFNALRGR